MNIYYEKGYESREEYLQDVAETYGAEKAAILNIADLLGPEEDFDGLLSEVADMTNSPIMEVTRK